MTIVSSNGTLQQHFIGIFEMNTLITNRRASQDREWKLVCQSQITLVLLQLNKKKKNISHCHECGN